MDRFKLNRLNNEKGMSLLELTVALALFAIIAVASLNLIYYSSRTNNSTEEWVEIVNNMNYALGIISRAIREVKDPEAISPEEGETSHRLDLPGNISFYEENNIIKMETNGKGQAITSKDKMDVTTLTFEREANNIIKIDLTVRSSNGQVVESSLKAAVRADM